MPGRSSQVEPDGPGRAQDRRSRSERMFGTPARLPSAGARRGAYSGEGGVGPVWSAGRPAPSRAAPALGSRRS